MSGATGAGETSKAAAELGAAHAGTQEMRQGAMSALARRAANWAATRPVAPLMLAIVAGLVVRLWLVARTHAMIDGDEAMVGLQAQGILHGRYPTYFYGQAYMGSLEAYLAAPLVALLGPTGWALRLVPIALSPLLVYLTWRLALALLPPQAPGTPLLAGLAALVAAAPPLYDAVAELRAWGGQIEIYIVSVALLLCAAEVANRLRAGAAAFELARRWFVLGLFAGLGIWINPLVTYALVAALLWLLLPLVERITPRWALWARSGGQAAPSSLAVEGVDGPHSTPASSARVLSTVLPLFAILLGLAIGGLPAWIYALHHGGENLLVYVAQPYVDPQVSGAARRGRLFLGAAITVRYFTCVAPAVLDGGLPGEPLALLPVRLLLLVPPVVGLACGVWLIWRRAVAPLRLGLPLLYAAVITAVFCLGTSAWAATKSCSWDWAGRYAVPLALVEPLLLLALLGLPAVLHAWRSRERAPAAGTTLGAEWPGGAAMWRLGLAALVLGGALQVATYGLASPTQTFQSPYYRRIPADLGTLLTYLKAHDIHAAWCNHWLGNVVTYESGGSTVCADYFDQVYKGGLRRPPGTLDVVSAADRASFILILAQPRPCLAHELDVRGVRYTLEVIPDAGVTVITPTSTVDPASVLPGLGQDYQTQPQLGSDCSNVAISSMPTRTVNSNSNSRVSPGLMTSRRPF